MKRQSFKNGCEYYSDCLTCPFPECKLDRARYPDVIPARLKAVIETWGKLLFEIVDDDRRNWGITALMRLRRKKSYRKDKRECRRLLKIPTGGGGHLGGYSRREVERDFEQIAGTEAETFVMGAVMDFADRHPLDKRHHMPYVVAFEELFYKRPKLTFPSSSGLQGFYNEENVFMLYPVTDPIKKRAKVRINGDGNLLVDWRKAPDEIAYLVRRKVRGDKNKFTDWVEIVEMFADGDFTTGFWAITKELPLR